MKTKLKDLIKEESIKVGDKVYYKVITGFGPKTMSAIVKKINGKKVTVQLTTQNLYGAKRIVDISKLNKIKK